MEMMTRWVVVAVVVLATVMTMAPSCRGIPGQSEEAVDEWFKRLPHAKPKLTKLHFFIHDILIGPNITVVQVAQANITDASPTRFGLIDVIDEQLTEGPGMDSKKVGQVEGVYVSSSKEALSVLVALNFVITQGKHKGSTLSVLGRVAEFSDNREFPILGGSGNFRLAQGFIIAKVHSADTTTGNRVVECRVQFLHY